MGFEAAKFMSKEKKIIISGVVEKQLKNAKEELKNLGFDVEYAMCDVSDKESVKRLAKYASSFGNVRNVINTAGISPNMGNPEKIININSLGTVHINKAFFKVMKAGSVIVDISSNSAYMLPKVMENHKLYALADSNEKLFLEKMVKKSNSIPMSSDYMKSGLAYALSKNFVVWYAGKCAFEYGRKGIRVASLCPGLIDTEFGRLEESEGSKSLKYGTERRKGKPEELGFAIATLADKRNGYLSAVDVICDGGCIVGKRTYRNFIKSLK